jgi:hypothetical protein
MRGRKEGAVRVLPGSARKANGRTRVPPALFMAAHMRLCAARVWQRHWSMDMSSFPAGQKVLAVVGVHRRTAETFHLSVVAVVACMACGRLTWGVKPRALFSHTHLKQERVVLGLLVNSVASRAHLPSGTMPVTSTHVTVRVCMPSPQAEEHSDQAPTL